MKAQSKNREKPNSEHHGEGRVFAISTSPEAEAEFDAAIGKEMRSFAKAIEDSRRENRIIVGWKPQ